MHKPTSQSLTIPLSTIERITGIRAHTFRTWEQRYPLLKKLRPADGWRYYTLAQARVLLNITLLNKAGHRISGIASLSEAEIEQKTFMLGSDALKQMRALHSLFINMHAIEVEHFEMVLNSAVQYWGLQATITEVLIPFLEKTGLLYQPPQSPAAVLVLGIARQKLVAAIEALPAGAHSTLPVLLFLAEKQHHELPLLHAQYLLKGAGISAVNLGPHLCLDCLQAIAGAKQALAYFTVLSKKQKPKPLQQFGLHLQNVQPTAPLVVLPTAGTLPPFPGVRFINAVQDLPRALPPVPAKAAVPHEVLKKLMSTKADC